MLKVNSPRTRTAQDGACMSSELAKVSKLEPGVKRKFIIDFRGQNSMRHVILPRLVPKQEWTGGKERRTFRKFGCCLKGAMRGR